MPRPPKQRARGLTLVELMVSITIALILLAGFLQLFVSNKQAYRLQEGASELNENFRYALGQLEYSIRMAGHWGGAKDSAIDVRGNVAPVNDCKKSPAFKNLVDRELDVGFGLEGFDGAPNSPLDCIPDNFYEPGTDVLLVRYAGAARECIATTLADETACMESDPDFADQRMLRASASYGADLFLGRDFSKLYGPNGTATSADIMPPDFSADRDLVGNYKAHFEVYFVRRCDNPVISGGQEAQNRCRGDASDIPALSRLVLSGNGLTLENLISGVEQFQVIYGVDDDNDRAPNRFVNAAEVRTGKHGQSDWSKVVVTRVSLVLRNNERDTTVQKDLTVYRLFGGTEGRALDYSPTPDDAKLFHRQAFSSSIQSRNTLRNLR